MKHDDWKYLVMFAAGMLAGYILPLIHWSNLS